MLEPEKLAIMQQAEKRQECSRRYTNVPKILMICFFIAGYTPSGFPYGVTWEEMGLEPWSSLPEADL